MKIRTFHRRLWRYKKRDKRSWRVIVQFGPGAGYVRWNDDRTKVLRHGRTLYVAWRSGSRDYALRFTGRRKGDWHRIGWLGRHVPLEAGLTRNANLVPYPNYP